MKAKVSNESIDNNDAVVSIFFKSVHSVLREIFNF